MQDISDCLSLEAQNVAEARLAAKRAARAEAREIRMKELERQQKEIYQVQKKYYGLDAKWGDIEQWMEDSERYSHRPRRNLQASDDDDLMSVTSRSSLRTNGYEDELLGPSQYRKSSRSPYYSDLNLASAPLSSKQQPQQSIHNGSRPSLLNCNSLPSRSQRGSFYDEGVSSSSRRSSSSRPPSEYSCYLGSGSRASSRASSARASPVVEERSDKDFGEKDSLAEVEEKYKRSMVTNAQLDNEKTSLQYQVDTLREVLLELEEELAESRRQYDEKHKECERQKHDQNVLRFQLAEMKEALEQRESLLTKHGIALDSVGTPNGDTSVEPHVNADSRPDPPIRATSMGPSEKVVEKKETMSVVGEVPPSETEQEKQEVMMPTLSHTPLNPEIEDKTKENIHESTEKPNDEGNTGGSVSDCQTNVEPQGEDLPGLEIASNQYEMAVDQRAAENLNKVSLEQNKSDLSEAIVDQRGSSPVESEVFQDALDDVVQSPVITSPLSEEFSESVADFRDESQNISQQDSKKDEDKCEVQNTSTESNSEPNKGTVQIPDNASVIPEVASDLPPVTKAEHETTSLGGSSPEDSEKSSADEETADVEKSGKVCEEGVRSEEQYFPVESGLQCVEDISIKTDSDINTPSENVLVSSETSLHADTHDVDGEKKIDITPEQSSQDTPLTKEEKQQADSKNNTFEEAVGDSDVLEDKISPLDADAIASGKVTGYLESPESEKLNTVAPNTPDSSMLGKEEQGSDDLVCYQSERDNEKTLVSETPSVEVLDEREQDTESSHPTSDKEINKSLQDSPNIQLLDEGKPGDHPTSEKSENDDINVVAETPKETVQSESFSSESESSPEGEESDNNNDNDNDMAERSEKYTGESLPLGSSVDNASTDDIRMEDGSDKGSRKGKGKNKEDCVVS